MTREEVVERQIKIITDSRNAIKDILGNGKIVHGSQLIDDRIKIEYVDDASNVGVVIKVDGKEDIFCPIRFWVIDSEDSEDFIIASMTVIDKETILNLDNDIDKDKRVLDYD